MSMFEPFFNGRSVDTGAIGLSFTPPLRGEGSLGSMPTASVPGKGFRSMVIPGLNSAVRVFMSNGMKRTKPSGISGASAPMVGKSLPGRLKFTPKGLGTILRKANPGGGPHSMTGPIYVEGAEPGDVDRPGHGMRPAAGVGFA